jgi:sarcosine oxidase, subunit delta
MRDEPEFQCAGTTAIARPPIDVSDEVWGEYLFFRENPKGVHRERWRHSFGCGQWFNVARDTVTHEVIGTYSMSESLP